MKKIYIIFSLCFVMLFNLVPAPTVYAQSSINFSRLAGADRYETSVAISQAGWSQANTVILATGLNYPDALAASSLSKSNNAPILLTRTDAMDPVVANEVDRLNATTAILIGGTSVIGTGVEIQLEALGITNIDRISGLDRFDTSAQIGAITGMKNGIIIATGSNFPDALSIAPIAAIRSIPVLLSPFSELDPYVSSLINNNSIPVSYIVGGTSVLSESVASSVPNGIRLSGANRYATNLSIVNRFSINFDWDTVYLATGENFPDALSGSAIAAKNYAPIILTDANTISQEAIDLIKSKNVKNVVILGGTSVISQNVIDAIEGIVYPVSPTGNLAYGRPLTSPQEILNVSAATDGIRDTYHYADIYNGDGPQWVQLDLGKSYDVNLIKLYHYFGDGRQYSDVIVHISNYADFSRDVVQVFNNDYDNSAGLGVGYDQEYRETASGLDIITDPINARYVRFYCNGSDVNNFNHYSEIEVYSEMPGNTLDHATDPLYVPTYDGANQSVHPSVVYFEDGWNGYHYWMVSTPYPYSNDAYENPSITASNDGYHWEVPSRLTNPLVPEPAQGHNCDPELFYNEATDELWVYYVETNEINKAYIKFMRSSNGVNWSSPQTIVTDNRSAYETVSPTVDYIASEGLYYMWTGNLNQVYYGQIELRTSSDGINWSSPQFLPNFTQDGCYIWHIYIRYIPSYNEYWCIFAAFPNGVNGEMKVINTSSLITIEASGVGDTMLYFAKSVDGINWTTYPYAPILDKGDYGAWDEGNVYRSCFIYNPDTDLFRVWYSALGEGSSYLIWYIGYTSNRFINMFYNLIY